MTQALLNNINTISDNVYANSNANTTDNNDVSSFVKILNTSLNEQAEQTNSNENSEVVTNIVSDLIQNLTQIKENCADTIDTISEVVENAIKETIAEEIVGSIADSTLVNVEQSDLSQQLTTDDASDETITNEDNNAMQKELNPLENPTLAVMLHSQIQTVRQLSNNDNDNQNVSEKQPVSLKNETLANLKNSEIQIENKSKDVDLFIDEDDTCIKQNNNFEKIIDDKIAEELNIEIVNSAELGENSSSDFMQQNQTPQEHGIKAVLNAGKDYKDIQIASNIKEFKPTEISQSKIIEQITKQLESMYNNTSKVNIVLNPESLGKVALQIINSKDGLLAQFTVTTQSAKDIISQGLNSLKDSLLAQGVSVDDVTVELSDNGNESENQFKWGEGSRGGNKGQQQQKQKGDNAQNFEQLMDGNV